MINIAHHAFVYDEDVRQKIAIILQKYGNRIYHPIHPEVLISMVDSNCEALPIADEDEKSQWEKVYTSITRTLIQLKQPYTIAGFRALVHATARELQMDTVYKNGQVHSAYTGLLDIPIYVVAQQLEHGQLHPADYAEMASMVASMYYFGHPDEHIYAIQTSIADMLKGQVKKDV